METKRKAKGSWGVRFFIVVLGITLGVLFYWLLSFIERDIGTMPGPQWSAVRSDHVDEALDARQKTLRDGVTDLNRQIQTLTEQQRLLDTGTDELQTLMNQLLAIQKQASEQNQPFPAESVQMLEKSHASFLKNHERFQELNQQVTDLTAERRALEAELVSVEKTIERQEAQAQEAYDTLEDKHDFKVGLLKLTFLVPVFIAVSFLFMKYRSTAWWPLVWAAFLATFAKIALVSFAYFPEEYFKYIALLVVIGVVIRLLVYLIRLIIAPKPDLLIRQYQQHYDKCICPVCSKPIRTGPLRYIGALHKKARVAGGHHEMIERQPYTCPSCGTNLYEKCGHCGQIRHTLLPYCEHCGAKKNE